jgi:hypothetical protein
MLHSRTGMPKWEFDPGRVTPSPSYGQLIPNRVTDEI